MTVAGLVLLASAVGVAQAAIPASQLAVLQKLYVQTHGDYWRNNSGWNGPPGTECSWFGITCNAAKTTVIGINLHDNLLDGVLPRLGGLPDLQVIEVGNWATRHSDPSFWNTLYGRIPPLNELKHLKVFKASASGFLSGDLPSLAGMTELEHFECVFCSLTGAIGSLAGDTHLKYFKVTGRPGFGYLHGQLPSLAGLTQLQYFYVNGLFTGPLPDLTGLTQLKTFYVDSFDHLSGGIPALVNLPNLQKFVVHGMQGGRLGQMANLPNLQVLRIDDGLLSGTFPDPSAFPNIRKLSIPGNLLAGPVPDLSDLGQLERLYIYGNRFQGPLPVPPDALVASAKEVSHAVASVCPNLLTPADNPPTASDQDWNTITDTTPWSKLCTAAKRPAWLQLHSDFWQQPSTAGQPVTFTATVHGDHPGGTVTFKAKSIEPAYADDDPLTLCADVAVVDHVASCTYSDLDPHGFEYNITAFYSGDAHNASASYWNGLVQFVISPINQHSSDVTAYVGQPVDLWINYKKLQSLTDPKAGFYRGVSTENGSEDADPDDIICGQAPVYTSRSGDAIAHCVTTFTKPGTHVLSMIPIEDRPGLGELVPVFYQHVKPAQPFDANQFALTGPWYEPATSGQGLELAVYPDLDGDGIAFLSGGWLTYDDAGHQRWYSLQGDLASRHGATFNLMIFRGDRGNFDAGPVMPAVAVGSAELTFYDCSHAVLKFHFDYGRKGTIPYVRVNAPTACSAAVPAQPPADLPAHYNDVLHGGAWYEPATSGQGLYLDLDPGAGMLSGAWFTYAPSGNHSDTGPARQRWFTLQSAHYTPGDLELRDVRIIDATGGMFNQPSPIHATRVGSADISFTSCTTMTLSYEFDKGEFAGQSGTIHEQGVAVPGCR